MVWFGLFWFDFVGIVGFFFWGGGGQMTSEFIHEEISIMNYHRGGGHDWHG